MRKRVINYRDLAALVHLVNRKEIFVEQEMSSRSDIFYKYVKPIRVVGRMYGCKVKFYRRLGTINGKEKLLISIYKPKGKVRFKLGRLTPLHRVVSEKTRGRRKKRSDKLW